MIKHDDDMEEQVLPKYKFRCDNPRRSFFGMMNGKMHVCQNDVDILRECDNHLVDAMTDAMGTIDTNIDFDGDTIRTNGTHRVDIVNRYLDDMGLADYSL
jgi:hypothetical protein